MLVALAMCVAAAGAAGAQTLSIADTSVSVTQARDQWTITLGYKITASSATTATLAATLTGPSSVSVGDMGVNMPPYTITRDIAAGTNWYYRDFFINLPRTATVGTYSVNYTVKWGTSSSVSANAAKSFQIISSLDTRCPILMYHKIGNALYSQYWNTTDMLRRQMAILKAYGYTSISCRELMSARAGLTQLPAKPVMITFDGGYENFYTDALPIISGFGFKPVMFLLTGVMGQDNSWDGDNNPVIMFMTWQEVVACYGSYNNQKIDLQSHSVTHPDFTTASTSTRNYELTHSRELIRSYFPDDPVDFFCYPYGSYNNTVQDACRSNYYCAAFAAGGGIETNCWYKWALKRIPIYWDVITDWDSSKQSSFFLNKIGEGFTVPSITVNSVQFLDAATGNPLPNNELKWGQTVKVRVVATNASATDVGVSLTLDNDSNTGNGVMYDSHACNPAEDVMASSWSGQRTFEWLWTPPVDAPTSQYVVGLYFNDKYYTIRWSSALYTAFTVKSDTAGLATAKTLGDGTYATFRQAAVTAAWPDCFYIELDSRATGLRVERPGHGIPAGSRVDVAGQLVTKASGERCLLAGYAAPNGYAAVSPVALNNRAVGGSALGLQSGVAGACGVNNIGLLVRVWGRVKSLDTINRVMVIDDGSGVDLKCAWSNGVVIDPEWTHVTLTGISSCERIGGQLSRLVLIVSAQGGK